MSETAAAFKRPVAQIPPEQIETLIGQLRRKEGGWLDWGQACKTLQESGQTTQEIFEETGFEAVQQLQVIVATQVFNSLEQGGASEASLAHYRSRGSDVLYELRGLDQAARVKAAEFALAQGLDMDQARAVAKDFKAFLWIQPGPDNFAPEPGDAVAYFCWKRGRERADLQDRSRLIAQGLKYAQTDQARQQLQALLTDFTVVPAKQKPRLPFYRLEQEDELPRMVPLVGSLPLSASALTQLPPWEETGSFRLVRSEQPCTWLALPGWQVVLCAQRPIALLCTPQELLNSPDDRSETLAALVDLDSCDWNSDSYFLVEMDGQLAFHWFAEAPAQPLLGKLILLLRPKRILDENVLQEPWQMV